MHDCVFCRIVAGDLPADKVYEDDVVVVFRDLNPTAPIHLLIVPRVHIPTLNDIPDGETLLSHIGSTARTVARKLGVAESGYRLHFNVNRGGGQVVFHLHAHLVAGGGLGTYLINGAVVLAILWNKLRKLVIR
jgi:histidine triad (HIT) family protein